MPARATGAALFGTLIFDLDGTLSDPSEGIARSINYALSKLGYREVETELVERLIGPPLTEMFEYLLGPLPEARQRELVDAYRERYAHIGYAENIIYEGIADAVATLNDRGYRLGVCTSKPATYAGRIVDMFGLSAFFCFVDGGDVHVTKSMQLEGLVAAGLDAGTAIMIGDRAVDITAAADNGLRSAGVEWGFAAPRELERAEPTYLLRQPADLLEIFA